MVDGASHRVDGWIGWPLVQVQEGLAMSKVIGTLGVLLVGALSVGAVAAPAATVKVGAIANAPSPGPANPAGWANYDTRLPGFHAPVSVPATPPPPLGSGSLQ